VKASLHDCKIKEFTEILSKKKKERVHRESKEQAFPTEIDGFFSRVKLWVLQFRNTSVQQIIEIRALKNKKESGKQRKDCKHD
jgi:hypothetical protein